MKLEKIQHIFQMLISWHTVCVWMFMISFSQTHWEDKTVRRLGLSRWRNFPCVNFEWLNSAVCGITAHIYIYICTYVRMWIYIYIYYLQFFLIKNYIFSILIIFKILFLWCKAGFLAAITSSVSHDPSEIILICWFALFSGKRFWLFFLKLLARHVCIYIYIYIYSIYIFLIRRESKRLAETEKQKSLSKRTLLAEEPRTWKQCTVSC